LEFFDFSDEYVQRLRSGDPVTEQHFTDYFSALIEIKLRSRLHSPQAVEDVRQETFLRVLRGLRSGQTVQDGRKLGAFVNSVCNNVVLEQYRSSARYAQMPDNAGEVPDPSWSAERVAVSEETRRAVREVLDEMPPKNRDLLRKVFFEERDRAEVCREMGVDVNYLRVLLYRARLKFKVRLLARSAGAKSAAQ
jgi:RNA polymerase sigma-70 factor, ECF subfamily